MRLHGGTAPGEQFHAYARRGFQNFALCTAHHARIFLRSLEKRKDVGAIKACDAAERGNRGARLSAFESAEKADRYARGTRHLGQRQATTRAQTAEALSRQRRRFCGRGDHALPLEFVHNGRGVQPPRAAKRRAAEDGHPLRCTRGNGWPCAAVKPAREFPTRGARTKRCPRGRLPR